MRFDYLKSILATTLKHLQFFSLICEAFRSESQTVDLYLKQLGLHLYTCRIFVLNKNGKLQTFFIAKMPKRKRKLIMCVEFSTKGTHIHFVCYSRSLNLKIEKIKMCIFLNLSLCQKTIEAYYKTCCTSWKIFQFIC